MTLARAERLLGEVTVAACRNRGIRLDRIDWNEGFKKEGELSNEDWYSGIRWTLPFAFGETYLPLIVTLLDRIVRGEPDASLHVGDMSNVLESFAKETLTETEVPARPQVELTALFAMRVMQVAFESGYPDPGEIFVQCFSLADVCHAVLEGAPDASTEQREGDNW